MAKRFIDTEIFLDEWFCELSPESKLFFIYFITNCDHAGILKLNKKLCQFQTKLKSIDTLIKELGNCLVSVKENVFFMPKFIKFQYPDFPKSKVRQQESAIKILNEYGLISEGKLNSLLTLNEDLVKSYDNVSDNVSDNEKKEKPENLIFPFKSENFKSAWQILLTQKKWKKKPESALQASLKKLSRYSEPVAIKMIEDCIAGEWQGLVEPKQSFNNTQQDKTTRFMNAYLEGKAEIEEQLQKENKL